ncbi:hypothetical protein KEM48_006213 [Puccinia striiformis f. sp. tritici PST-130]|nr:hypothetical protein KEM48_006213 [Puccinia striiformis f. sp. tritici PST-130]
MQRTPTRTRSQGPVDFPLDQDIDKLGRLNNQRKKTPLKDVPQSTPNRQEPIDPLHVPSSRSSSRSSPPAKPERAPEDPQGLISTLIRALNARPTSDHTTSKFKTPGMKARTASTAKVLQNFAPSFEPAGILFSNDPGTFTNDRQRFCMLSYLGGRAAQWFEPYLELLDSKSRIVSLIIDKFEQQLFTLFGDPNEVRNAEYELNNLQMKESGKASAYIAQFRTLQSRISWNDSAFTFIFAKDFHLESPTNWRLVDCALPPSNSLIDRTIELDNCYHDKNRSKKPDTSSKQDDLRSQTVTNPEETATTIFRYPSFSSSKPRTRTTPQEISSVLSKEGFLKGTNALDGRKKAYSLLDSGANVSFISFAFAKSQSLELIECKKFPFTYFEWNSWSWMHQEWTTPFLAMTS